MPEMIWHDPSRKGAVSGGVPMTVTKHRRVLGARAFKIGGVKYVAGLWVRKHSNMATANECALDVCSFIVKSCRSERG